MNVTAIIQARMGSSRLPGKILKKVVGKPLLAIQLERLKASLQIDQFVVATTVEPQDDVIEQFCNENYIKVYRGSENDVLARYYEASQIFDGDIIVRLTSDCPIIDASVVDDTIAYYRKYAADYDYVSNTIERTYPRGLDTEVFSAKALEKAYHEATLKSDREHVTAYFYTNPDKFLIGSVKGENNYSHYRWTVDTKEDFELIRLIIETLYPINPLFSVQDAVKLMKKNPDWWEINAHIEQKSI